MKPERGVLLLHGFSGSPGEVAELGERLEARGYPVHAPALPGHDGEARTLRHMQPADYFASVEATFDETRTRWSGVYIVGFSMGGTLGLHLAQRRPVAGLVTINTPLRMPAHVQQGIPWVARRIADAPLLVNVNALLGGFGYSTVPAAAVHTFLNVLTDVRRGLADVRCPLLVLHSARDETVPAFNAAEIAEGVSSADREAVVLPAGPHLITVGRGLDTIEPLITTFLARLDRGAMRDDRTKREPS